MLATSEPIHCRRAAFTLLILASAAMMAARILAADWATVGFNDRSRWCTIRALVDDGTFVIGHRKYNSDGNYVDSGVSMERDWQTTDKFLHPEKYDFYSGKPPLFPTVAALVYWILKHTLGWSITNNRLAILRCTLLIVNCLPITIYLTLIGRLLEQLIRTDWGRLFLMVAACFATYMTTFAIVLNNHTVAASFVMFALYQAFGRGRKLQTPRESWLRFAAAGFFAACAAAADLPAAAFLVWLGLILYRRSPRLALFSFAPAALVPVVAFIVTNYLAIGHLRPAYSEFGGPWYTYPGSYWEAGAQQGIDIAGEKESKIDYALHLLVGHHGLFSLTPIFLLGLFGLLGEWPDENRAARPASILPEKALSDEAADDNTIWHLSLGAWLLAAIVIFFYIFKTSSYGGVTAGPRWLFWLTPLLLLSASPIVDVWAKHRRTRCIGYIMLSLSIFSVHFSISRPWSHPWLYQFMSWQNWLPY